jgi:predicted flap endonuclease-1-like 5' DNA nuclease
MLAADAEAAERPAADASLPANWSAAPLTGEDIARELADAAEATGAEAEVKAEEAPPDDLTRIKGIGPKTAAALAGGGVRTFAELAAASRQQIERILREAGVRSGDVDGWREQAALAARGEQKARPRGDDAP